MDGVPSALAVTGSGPAVRAPRVAISPMTDRRHLDENPTGAGCSGLGCVTPARLLSGPLLSHRSRQRRLTATVILCRGAMFGASGGTEMQSGRGKWRGKKEALQTVEFDILLVDSFTTHQRLQKHLAS